MIRNAMASAANRANSPAIRRTPRGALHGALHGVLHGVLQGGLRGAAAVLLIGVFFSATARAQQGPSDEQRLKLSNALADCAAYYRVAAQRSDLPQAQRNELMRHSIAAVDDAARVTNRKVAILRQRQTEQTLGAGGAAAGQYDDRCRTLMGQMHQR